MPRTDSQGRVGRPQSRHGADQQRRPCLTGLSTNGNDSIWTMLQSSQSVRKRVGQACVELGEGLVKPEGRTVPALTYRCYAV